MSKGWTKKVPLARLLLLAGKVSSLLTMCKSALTSAPPLNWTVRETPAMIKTVTGEWNLKRLSELAWPGGGSEDRRVQRPRLSSLCFAGSKSRSSEMLISLRGRAAPPILLCPLEWSWHHSAMMIWVCEALDVRGRTPLRVRADLWPAVTERRGVYSHPVQERLTEMRIYRSLCFSAGLPTHTSAHTLGST